MTQDTQAGAGAHPAPAQQPKTLRELAEVVRDWGKRDHAWAHPDPDCFDVALFGHISEDGEPYPVAEVNPDTYGHEGVSLQLAQFYAAASPAAVLALLDRVALRDNELKAARADAKHWRTNHDNVVARLRIFTQRPDIPKELADRLPWYRELVRLQEVEAQALQQSAEITDAEIDRIAESMPGGLDGFLKAWGWRQFARAIMQAAPPAPAAVAVPEALRELIEAIEFAPLGVRAIQAMARARAALAAAPAQAVAVPEGWKLVPINDTPAMWTAGGRAIKSCGGHERDAASLAYKAMVEAAPPAQEHATQLAGQALPVDEFRGDTASLVRNIVALLDLDAQGCLVPHGVGGHARGLLSAAASRLAASDQAQGCTRSHPHENMSPMCVLRTEIARLHHAAAIAQATAAPAQAQEDARDAGRWRHFSARGVFPKNVWNNGNGHWQYGEIRALTAEGVADAAIASSAEQGGA